MTAWQTMLTVCGYCDELPCQCPDPDTSDLSEAREFAAMSYARGLEEGLKRARDAVAAVPAEVTTHGDDWRDLPGSRVKREALAAIDALRGES